MPLILDGKKTAETMMVTLKQKVAALKASGVTPGLAVILVGNDPASAVYVRNKQRRATMLGLYARQITLPESTSQEALLEAIAACNQDPLIDGILVQLPLPAHLDTQAVLDAIAPKKDVDGFHPLNMGRLWLNKPGVVASTPYGIMALLAHYDIDVAGMEAVIVGRSTIVGRPLAALLVNHNATVTTAHTYTADLKAVTRRADLLVVAAGRPGVVTGDMVKPGAVVIDVGMNRRPDGQLVGDVDFASVAPKAQAITPVPGGVGPMTIAALMSQTVALAEARDV